MRSSWRRNSPCESCTRNPGIDSSLSSVPPVWPRPRPDILPNSAPHDGHEGRQHEGDLVADAAARVLVEHGAAEHGQVEPLAAVHHGPRQAHRLGRREPAHHDGHEQRARLVGRDRAVDHAGTKARRRASSSSSPSRLGAISRPQSRLTRAPPVRAGGRSGRPRARPGRRPRGRRAPRPSASPSRRAAASTSACSSAAPGRLADQRERRRRARRGQPRRAPRAPPTCRPPRRSRAARRPRRASRTAARRRRRSARAAAGSGRRAAARRGAASRSTTGRTGAPSRGSCCRSTTSLATTAGAGRERRSRAPTALVTSSARTPALGQVVDRARELGRLQPS